MHYKSLDSALLAYGSMNGRYFAGKQITCEFVAVTRWKAAICGEYMRSRYKTCSHGAACNFIHCFRNPGGDYEWADWDNPPPRYWVRKMAALFGSSAGTLYEKASDTPDVKSSEGSDRKRLKSSSNRYVSRGSRDEDVHTRHSSRDYSHSKQEHSSHRVNYEHGHRRRDSTAADKQQRQDIEDTKGRQFSTIENDSRSHRHKHKERHRRDHGNGEKDDKITSRKHHSDWHGSLEPESSGWPSDSTDRDINKGRSGNKSTSRHNDARKSRTRSLEYYNLERHHSTSQKPAGKEHSTTRALRHDIEDDYHDEKDSERGKSLNHKDFHDDFSDRWVATNSDVDSDVDRYQSLSKGTMLGRKDDAHSDDEARNPRSSRRTKDDKRRKRRNGNRQCSGTDENASDSDTKDLSSDSWSCRSRSSEENFSAHISKRKRSRSKKSSS